MAFYRTEIFGDEVRVIGSLAIPLFTCRPKPQGSAVWAGPSPVCRSVRLRRSLTWQMVASGILAATALLSPRCCTIFVLAPWNSQCPCMSTQTGHHCLSKNSSLPFRFPSVGPVLTLRLLAFSIPSWVGYLPDQTLERPNRAPFVGRVRDSSRLTTPVLRQQHSSSSNPTTKPHLKALCLLTTCLPRSLHSI